LKPTPALTFLAIVDLKHEDLLMPSTGLKGRLKTIDLLCANHVPWGKNARLFKIEDFCHQQIILKLAAEKRQPNMSFHPSTTLGDVASKLLKAAYIKDSFDKSALVVTETVFGSIRCIDYWDYSLGGCIKNISLINMANSLFLN